MRVGTMETPYQVIVRRSEGAVDVMAGVGPQAPRALKGAGLRFDVLLHCADPRVCRFQNLTALWGR